MARSVKAKATTALWLISAVCGLEPMPVEQCNKNTVYLMPDSVEVTVEYCTVVTGADTNASTHHN